MEKLYSTLITFLLVFLSGITMAQQPKANVLVLFHSDKGGTYQLAKDFVKGLESNKSVRAVIKQVKVSGNPELENIPIAAVDELSSYDGIAFGSPVYFGNISTAMS